MPRSRAGDEAAPRDGLGRLSAARRDWLLGLLLVGATLVAYSPVRDAGFIWDDQYYLTDSMLMSSFAGIVRAWTVIGASLQYYPMTHTSFWAEYFFFGMDPTGYHVTNVLLHIANALLVWRLLARLAVPGAWLVAAVFALHPVHVETAAWIAERKNLLSTLFYLLAAHAYFRWQDPVSETSPSGARSWYASALVFHVFALCSKAVTFSLPAALALVLWWKRGRLSWVLLRPLLPFLGASALLGSLSVYMEKYAVGARGASWDFTIVDRLLIAGRAVWFYVGKLVWPRSLSFSYPRWNIDAAEPWQYLFPIAAVGVVAALWWWRHRIGRGPLTALLYFGGTLVPALGFVDVYPFRFSFVADHFQYLASIGMLTLLVAVPTRALESRLSVPLRAGLAAALLLTLAVLTFQQARIYESPFRLWSDVIEKNPESTLAHNNLAAVYADQGEIAKAVTHNRETLRIDPSDNLAHLNLAINLTSMGRLDEAIHHHREQIRLYDDRRSHEAVALLMERRGRIREALQHYEAAQRGGSRSPLLEGKIRRLRARLGH